MEHKFSFEQDPWVVCAIRKLKMCSSTVLYLRQENIYLVVVIEKHLLP